MTVERLRILILDGETNAARAVLQSLGRAGHECMLAAAVPRGPAFASHWPSRELQSPDPLLDSEAFLEWLEAAHEARGYDLVLPLTETTLVPLHEERRRAASERGAPRGLVDSAILPPFAALDTMLDKEALRREAESLGIPVPATWDLPARSPIEREVLQFGGRFPVVVKPALSKVWVDGRGSDLQVRVARDPNELQSALSGMLPVVAVQLQEWLPGRGIGIEALVDNGKIILHFAHERLHEYPLTGGRSTYRRSLALPQPLLEAATRLLEKLRWHGVATVEFRVEPGSQRFWLLEVNGRFGGSLPLACFAGVDFPAALVEMWRGQEIRPSAARSGTRYARDFTGELQWGKAALRNVRHPDPLVQAPSLWRAALEWGRVLGGRETWDGASFGDPLPLVQEVVTALWSEARNLAARPWRELRTHRRRQDARKRLESKRSARRILVLCHGNICRSPYAGMRLAALGQDLGLEVRTAGFSRHEGRTAPELFKRLTAARGVDLRSQRSARVDSQLLGWAELILVMDRTNERELEARDRRRARRALTLGSLDPHGGSEIEDPYVLPAQETVAVLEQIDRCVEALVTALGVARAANPETVQAMP